MTNDFHAQLAAANSDEAARFFMQIYKNAWPNFVSMTVTLDNMRDQHAGVDRLVRVDVDGEIKEARVEEKIRDKEKKYTDILLEWMSNDRTKTPGWIEKPLRCHYLVYGMPAFDVAYLFPWPALRAAWAEHKESLKRAYGTIRAPNLTYKTLSTPVPHGWLFDHVDGVRRICLSPDNQAWIDEYEESQCTTYSDLSQ